MFVQWRKLLHYHVFFRLTTTLTSLIGIVAAKFSDKMNVKGTGNSNKENVNSLITNIFFEVSFKKKFSARLFDIIFGYNLLQKYYFNDKKSLIKHLLLI